MTNLFCRAAAPALLLLLGSNVAAQEAPIEEVIVTGSYIRGSAEDAPSPVQTIQREDIVASGVTDVADLIRNLEIASGSDTAPTDGARFNGSAGAGLANVNLRGLGPTSTLVLLDGKRLPFAGQKISDGDRFVDINSIPVTMIQRVEVLTNGASATYGSDAIAGVINFITRQNFEGFELTGKFQSVDDGDQDDGTYGAIFGWASDDGDTHFVIGGEYFDRTLMESSDRFDLRRDLYPNQGSSIVNRFSFTGLDPLCTSTSNFYPDNDTNSDPFVCSRAGAETGLIMPDQERTSIMATFTHTFNENAEVYAQVNNMVGESGSSRNSYVGPIEPKYFFPSLLGAASFAPFVPDPFAGGAPNDPSTIPNGGPLPAAPIPGVVPLPLELADYTVRTPGIGPQRRFKGGNETENWRYQLGVRGDFTVGDKAWNYDVSATHGTNNFTTKALGLDKDRLELAMYGLGGPNCTPNGTIDPTDPRAAGARFLLAGADGQFNDLATAPGAIGPLETTMLALMGTVPNFPFINPDNLVLGMTSNNNGDQSQGCSFFNPFLSRQLNPALANSDELLRWIEVPISDYQETDTHLTSFDVVFSGELFEMGDNMASIAIGAQYREEGRETKVNPQTTGSINSFGQMSGGESVGGLSENLNFDADRDVWAVFAELALPIGEDIDLQIAGRYEDYGDEIGSTFDPKLAVRWQTTDSLVLRAAISSSFRGPALAQVEEGTGFSLEFGVRDVLGEQSRPEGDNCVRTGRCGILTPGEAPSIIIVKQGRPSPDLEPETAVTWNVGAIWSPVDGPLAGLTVGLDYYSIDFEDKIIDVPTQAFLTEELALFQEALAAGDFVIVNPTLGNFGTACDPSDAIYDPGAALSESCQVNPNAYAINATNSSFNGNITRRADNSRDLQIIASNAINTGRVETSGIDFNLSYIRSTDIGDFAFASRLNWIREYKVSDFPVGQPDFDAAGFTNRSPTRRLARSMPDLKGNASLTWLRGNHTSRLGVRYVGQYVDNSALRLERSFSPYYAFDLSYGYTFNLGDDSTLVLTVGAIDLFDEDLPNVRDGRGVDLTVFDQRGRRFYASATYRL